MIKKTLTKISLSLLILASVNVSFAQENENKSFSLKEAQDFALINNTNIKNSKIDVKIAKKKVLETTSMGLPQVSGSASYQNIFETQYMTMSGAQYMFDNEGHYTGVNLTENKLALGVKENITFDLTVSQLLFSGEYLVGLKASKTYKELSQRSLVKTENDVRDLVSQAYYFVLVAKENKRIFEESYTSIEKTYNETVKLFEAGMVGETDADQLKITVLNLKNTISAMTRQVEIAENLLKFQMGINVNETITLTESLEQIINNVNSEALKYLEFNIENHIDYQLINTQEKLSKLSLRREQSTVLPTLSAFYKHQEMKDEPEFNFMNPDMLGVSLNVPIFGSGLRYSKIQQAKLELQKSTNTKEFVAQSLQMNVVQARNEFNSSLEKYMNEKDNLTLAERIYNNTLTKYKEGMSSSFELNQAQSQFLSIQGGYFNAIFELLNSKNKLDKAINNY